MGQRNPNQQLKTLVNIHDYPTIFAGFQLLFWNRGAGVLDHPPIQWMGQVMKLSHVWENNIQQKTSSVSHEIGSFMKFPKKNGGCPIAGWFVVVHTLVHNGKSPRKLPIYGESPRVWGWCFFIRFNYGNWPFKSWKLREEDGRLGIAFGNST